MLHYDRRQQCRIAGLCMILANAYELKLRLTAMSLLAHVLPLRATLSTIESVVSRNANNCHNLLGAVNNNTSSVTKTRVALFKYCPNLAGLAQIPQVCLLPAVVVRWLELWDDPLNLRPNPAGSKMIPRQRPCSVRPLPDRSFVLQ